MKIFFSEERQKDKSKIFKIALFTLFSFYLCSHSFAEIPSKIAVPDSLTIEIDPSSFGAKGDGVSDDTAALQQAFNMCSDKGLTCRIAAGKNYLVTSPVFFWGKASLKGGDGRGIISFNVLSSPYLLNIGIRGRDKLGKPFSGEISDVKFKVIGGQEGRVIFFWRTDGAKILNNTFDVGSYPYSATSSGNDNNWVVNGFSNLIRKNISIIGNKIIAAANHLGSEGIGLGHFDGVLVQGNTVTGVGDDPIGIHFCQNVKIINNDLKSVDGRIFISNSKNVEIANNRHERMRSLKDGKFYTGIALLYVGFETLEANSFAAPTNIYIHHNYLYYPVGAIDLGAAIYLYGPRATTIEHNTVVNDSAFVKATALHLLPAPFSGFWTDPDHIDSSKIARVWDVNISNNSSIGTFPRGMIMTGNCIDYKGKVFVKNNIASNFKFYCDQVDMSRNH